MVTCCLAPPQLGPEMTGGGLGSLPAFSAQARLSPAGSCVYVCVCGRSPLCISQPSLAPALLRGLGPEPELIRMWLPWENARCFTKPFQEAL